LEHLSSEVCLFFLIIFTPLLVANALLGLYSADMCNFFMVCCKDYFTLGAFGYSSGGTNCCVIVEFESRLDLVDGRLKKDCGNLG